MNQKTYILNTKRSAVTKYGGSLVSLSAPNIASQVIRAVVKPLSKKKIRIDEIILGNVISAGLGQNPARIAAVGSGILSDTIPAFTVNKVCISGLKSIILAVQAIGLEEGDCFLAGGMESMSNAPYLLNNYRFGAKLGDQEVKDAMIQDGLWCSLVGKHMGWITEKLASKFRISRAKQDAYALKSHQKAVQAIKGGRFKKEIIAIKVQSRDKTDIVDTDEQPRPDSSITQLAKLKPIFKKNGTITAGNASSLNDGAAVVLLASEKLVKTHNLKPMAVIKSWACTALNPSYFGIAVDTAVRQCLQKAKMSIKDIDLWEINEAFACQMLTVLKLLKIDPKIVNVNGGAIALGHPIGASGARILTTLIYELKRRNLKYGVAALCAGGGQGAAVLIENI